MNRLRAARKARHHLNRSGTISQTVEYLHGALALASNHDLGMAIAELDLPDWPASSVKLAENNCRAIPGASRRSSEIYSTRLGLQLRYNLVAGCQRLEY